MARIASSVRLPLAAGENYFTPGEFDRAARAGALRIAMPDITRVGGFTGMRDIVGRMRALSVECSPHHFGTDLGFVASLHFMTAVPAGLEMLRDVSNCPLKWEVIGGQPIVEGGYALAPDGPGLGIEIDQGAVEKYLEA
jgi:L-alanine-DL-glutamate epimerase-like enolase superfamily enzyme